MHIEILYPPAEADALIIADRHAAERLHAALNTLTPDTIGAALYSRLEDKLCVLYGRLEPYQPFGPY